MTDIEDPTVPRHVAIIMDGNGRWALARGQERVNGHQKGADTVSAIVTACRERGIKVLTLFAFSSQNWSRPPFEINSLMSLLLAYLKSERAKILDNGIRLTAMGNLDLLPDQPREALTELIEASKGNDDMVLCLSLSYGGQEEIVSMVQNIAAQAVAGKISPEAISSNTVQSAMWSGELGPVDLLVRTSGELRISNFLLWSIAYAELYFTDLMWPDFDEEALDKALAEYGQRQRRFGTIK